MRTQEPGPLAAGESVSLLGTLEGRATPQQVQLSVASRREALTNGAALAVAGRTAALARRPARGVVSCAVAVLCSATIAPWAAASPTGLNNIPTADVVPEDVLVLQQFTNFGSDQVAIFTGGQKYAPAPRLEIGLDDRIGTANDGAGSIGVAGAGGAPAGPPVLQAKYRFLDNDARLPGAIGIANISGSSRAGDEAFYIALKRNIGRKVRGHATFLTSGRDDAFFVGADGPIGASDWTWRVDGIQTNDGENWLSSLGAIGPLGEDFLVEGWVSIPSQSGVNETFTLKFDYIIGD